VTCWPILDDQSPNGTPYKRCQRRTEHMRTD
jgi:hypothetical protein